MIKKIPQPVIDIVETLQKADFEAFVVGGCVRDLILEREPKDWDITTNATPEKIVELFPDSFYENEFGTVGVKTPRFIATTDPSHENDIIEVTTYRTEGNYQDNRHPTDVHFTLSLEEDLARRDFTMNALAYGPRKNTAWELVDLFSGVNDIEKKIIRTVGNPEERFAEDALRLMRAIRLWTELRDPKEEKPTHNWNIDDETFQAIQKLSDNLSAISQERIRDELSKIILSQSPRAGIEMLHGTKLLRFIIPELELGVGVGQNLHHTYTVWEHNLRALETCPSKKLDVLLAALLHDVGKPATKRGNGYNSTFYNHDHVGARITEKILTRLRFPKATIKKATLLVDNHLFYYNVDEVTEASVRRLIKRVGLENMNDLMAVRIGDRLGSGVPKAKPYKLRHLEYMIDKVSKDPISVKMLAIKGTDLIKDLTIPAGPQIGAILDVLLAETIENPLLNTKDELLKRASALKENPIETLRELAKEKIEEKREEDNNQIKKKYWVE
ncbi:MAG: HDIG domain-containing metalloprotein [Candidatus Moraniibacteriota bacterium]